MYLFIIFLGLISYWLFKVCKKPDKFPPGPPKLPVVGGLPFFLQKGSLLQSNRHMVAKYGKICGVFFGKAPAVIIGDYNVLKELFKKEEVAFRPPIKPLNELRPGWQTVGKEYEGSPPGVIASNGHYWREQRRFLLKNLKDFGFGKSSMESIIQEEMVKLCSKLAEIPENEKADLNRTMNVSVLNSLWLILVGEKLELDDPKSNKLIRLFDKFIRENNGPVSPIVGLLPHPSMAKWPGLRWIFGFDAAAETFTAAKEFILKYIDDHQKTLDPENIRDFTDLFLLEIKNTTDENSSFYKERGYYNLFNDIIDMFLAGMETTSSSLMWTFLFLLHHPNVQKKIHKELDEVVGKNRYPSLEDRPNLHYLNAVMAESFRTTSLVVAGVPHFAKKEVKVGDYIIPEGTTIFGSLYNIMNDPSHFKNPHVFCPERFIDAEGKFVTDERVIPFGIGKRVCLGQTLADKEFYIFLSGLLQQFEIQHAPGTTLPTYDIEESFPKAILRSVPTYYVNLKQRLRS